MKVKTALVTGASSGIGEELARVHAANGGNLVIIARSEDKLLKLKDELEGKFGIEVVVIVKDLSDPVAIRHIYEEVTEMGIEIDYLINCAGYGRRGYFLDKDLEGDISMMNVIMFAPTTLCKMFVPDMVKRGYGKVLNVSTAVSRVPGPLQAVYFASKAYLDSFTNALSYELRDTGVTVTNLMPGAVRSRFADRADMDDTLFFKFTATPQKIAKDGYLGMLKGKRDVVSGISPVIVKGMNALPRGLIMWIVTKGQSK